MDKLLAGINLPDWSTLSDIDLPTWGRAFILLVFGFIVASFVSAIIGKALRRHASPHYTLLVRRVFYYGIIFLFFILALTTLDLTAQAWGLAGIITLAIGIASQSAISNIISGLFLVFERPFVVGDLLEFEEYEGEVLSIDLLSIKIRTRDNVMIRIPNQVLVRSEFINNSRFPIRRLDVPVKISFDEDIEKVKQILQEVVDNNRKALASPPAQAIFDEFGLTAIHLKFIIWVKQSAYFELKNDIPTAILKLFQERGIKMPRALHSLNNEGKVE